MVDIENLTDIDSSFVLLDLVADDFKASNDEGMQYCYILFEDVREASQYNKHDLLAA